MSLFRYYDQSMLIVWMRGALFPPFATILRSIYICRPSIIVFLRHQWDISAEKQFHGVS